ncbi:hypothetical protein [Herbaspirillum sp. C9C3]|uniref:hypothetical protein n=1 Tax=Herbaspirillum sp. C9C3 TaxID=2735271 RepID=UPI0015844F86|nr:hypothetical protein [Herbaspirillum sp. C9C3]NUT60766.1 hypothetical protein [Herbaspirillum sp. C9C3]
MSRRALIKQQDIASAALLGQSKIYPAEKQVTRENIFCHGIWSGKEYVELPGRDKNDQFNFTRVGGFPDGLAVTAAEFCYSLLKNPIESHQELAWLSIAQHLSCFTDFANYAVFKGCYRLSDVDQPLLEDYLNVLMNGDDLRKAKSIERTKSIITTIYLLWDYSPRLSEPFLETPFNCSKEDLLSGMSKTKLSSENKTPPIPEAIFGPIMGICFDYVQKHSGTILCAWKALQNEWDNQIKNLALSDSGKEKRLTKAARNILASLPATWRKNGWTKRGDLYKELYSLRNACLMVVLAYSGVRASELFNICANCCVYDDVSDDERIHYLNTTLRKHRHKGSKDTWVIVEEVVDAIRILEQLTVRARIAFAKSHLVITGMQSDFFSVQKIDDFRGYQMFTTEGLIEAINTFQRHIGQELIYAPIPLWTDENGQKVPWHFTLMQFRRTLARYIARQPYGIIAGMRQYKHVLVTVFQGYASLDAEWINILHEEDAFSSLDCLNELALGLKMQSVAGEAAQELKRTFEDQFGGRDLLPKISTVMM